MIMKFWMIGSGTLRALMFPACRTHPHEERSESFRPAPTPGRAALLSFQQMAAVFEAAVLGRDEDHWHEFTGILKEYEKL